MRAVPLVLLLCLCAAATTGVLAWRSDDTPPPVAPAPRDPVVAEAAAHTARDDAPAAPAVAGEGATTPPEAGDEADRSSAGPDVVDLHGPHVLVVRGNPPLPVGGAEVFYVTERDAQQRLRQRPEPLQRSEWPEHLGGRIVAGEDGLANLPATRAPYFVAARSGDGFAFATAPPGERTTTLVLAKDETVVVEARTAEDEPAPKLPVALLWHGGGDGEAATLWQDETDAKGRAVCHHFQVARPDPRGDPANERFAAMLAVPIPVPVVATFPGRPTGEAPVLLRVPPLTAVEVTLTDHRGTPLLSPAGVALWIDRPRDAQLPFPVPGGFDRPRRDKPVGADPVRFPFVAANCPVRLGARFPGGDRRGAMVGPLWTPADPKEELHAQLPLGPDLALFAGTVLGPDGEPWRGPPLRGCLWRAEGPLEQLVVHTVPDGRFDVVQRPQSGLAEVWLDLRADLPRDQDTQPGGPAEAAAPLEVGARVRFQALRAGERRELGTIRLGDLPLVASGIVVDDVGAPVVNAEVKLQRREPDPPGKPADPKAEPWRDLPLLATRTLEDGTFALAGEWPVGQLRLRADTDHHFADTAPVHTAGQQVRIVLQRNGILRGRVLLPDWLSDGTVTMTLRPVDESRRAADTRSVGLQRRGGGRFTIEPLRPGRYDAVVSVRNVPEPLCVLAEVFVPPGEARDARLRPLDLRQSLFRYRLRAVDPGGRTLPIDGPILARFRKFDGGVAEAGFRWQKGTAELISGSSLAELIAFGQGCEPTSVLLGPGDHDVYLRQVVPCQLYLPGARNLCGLERRVRVSVVLTTNTGLPEWLQGTDQRTGESFSFARWDLGKSNGAWLGTTDDVQVPIVRTGKYEVVLRIYATDSERSPQASVPLGVHQLFADGSMTAPVTVPVDPAKVQAALRQLAPRPGQPGGQPGGQRGERRRG